jgi:AcrR family transcriptional regulator
MIAEAAHELGLEGLTLRAVADHLDVSIAALYHHVSGKDDLMRLAAEHSVAQISIPQDRGQHWAVWLHEWATYNRDIFLAQPPLLAQYVDGAIPAEVIVPNVDRILGVLVRQGFGLLDANAAYELVTACALGAAVATTRERVAAESGRTLRAMYADVLDSRGPDELPHLRALMKELRGSKRRTFDAQIATVLHGIAIEQGLKWAPIERTLAEHTGAARAGRRN